MLQSNKSVIQNSSKIIFFFVFIEKFKRLLYNIRGGRRGVGSGGDGEDIGNLV